jgi:hypothetical protein
MEVRFAIEGRSVDWLFGHRIALQTPLKIISKRI